MKTPSYERQHPPTCILGVLALALWSVATTHALAQLKINEVYYNVSPQGGNQFVELYNSGPSTDYLDGKILTDEATTGTEGIFQFPGSPGESNYPVASGAYVFIAVDAKDATAGADWECYAGAMFFDSDNPAVSNLTLIGGAADLSLFPGDDNIILADGSDTMAPISASSIIDGLNYGSIHSELAMLSAVSTDSDPNVESGPLLSLNRCPDGDDSDVSSAADLLAFSPTPGAANAGCSGLPQLSIADNSQVEGNAGSADMTFTLTLNPSSASTVSVVVITQDGSAGAPTDYTALPSTNVIFSPGTTMRSVSVSINGDTTPELDESFFVNLSHPTNAVIIDAQAEGTILDDESGVLLAISDAAVTEGDTGTVQAIFEVTLSSPAASTVTVQYSTADGVATSPSDYASIAGTTLGFSIGQTTQAVSVTVNGDTGPEATETFFVHLTNAVNAILGDAVGLGIIANDDELAFTMIEKTPGAVTPTWNASPGTKYQVQFTTNLMVWYNVSGVVTATSSTASTDNPIEPAATHRHFSVQTAD